MKDNYNTDQSFLEEHHEKVERIMGLIEELTELDQRYIAGIAHGLYYKKKQNQCT